MSENENGSGGVLGDGPENGAPETEQWLAQFLVEACDRHFATVGLYDAAAGTFQDAGLTDRGAGLILRFGDRFFNVAIKAVA